MILWDRQELISELEFTYSPFSKPFLKFALEPNGVAVRFRLVFF
jgi:hypothetical protein